MPYKKLDNVTRNLEFLEKNIDEVHCGEVEKRHLDALHFKPEAVPPLGIVTKAPEELLPRDEAFYNPEVMLHNELLDNEPMLGNIINSVYTKDDFPYQVRSNHGITMTHSILGGKYQWISMFAAGYMFQTYEHMTKVMNGPIGQEVFDRVVKEQGVRPLGSEYLGTRQINMVEDKPIRTPADLRGVNIRMPNSDAWIFLGKALGANPTPISFTELYMALQTKTVDGQDNPLPTNKNAKFYEVTKSVSITNHIIDSVWPTINEAKWQSLTQQQKDWVMEGVRVKRCMKRIYRPSQAMCCPNILTEPSPGFTPS
ncbi:MAG: TRAP transporter substrate-binding protein DctP [Treponema sp.]|jgi:hypothetical protein|nr:TRAP transporter substrate-binding protein DctP [Treponema sp.]